MGIKIAMVGCGAIAKLTHVPTILKNAEFELTSLVDVKQEAMKNLKKEFGLDVKFFSDYRELSACEAAIVSVPPHLHSQIAISLMQKGIHVLCEKPMATSYADASKMMETAKAEKKILHVGMTKQYCQNTRVLTDILKDRNILGKVEEYELRSGTRSGWNADNPRRYDPDYVLGGVVFENGVHWIYRILRWFGYPEILRYEDDRIDGVEANAIISCIHKHVNNSAIYGTIQFSADQALRNSMIIKGTTGLVQVYENDEDAIHVTLNINDKSYDAAIRNPYFDGTEDLFSLQLKDFAESIQNKRQPDVSVYDAVNSIKFIEEAYSMRKPMKQNWVFNNIKRN